MQFSMILMDSTPRTLFTTDPTPPNRLAPPTMAPAAHVGLSGVHPDGEQEAGKRRKSGAEGVDGDVDPGVGHAAQRRRSGAEAERLELPAKDGPADQNVEQIGRA